MDFKRKKMLVADEDNIPEPINQLSDAKDEPNLRHPWHNPSLFLSKLSQMPRLRPFLKIVHPIRKVSVKEKKKSVTHNFLIAHKKAAGKVQQIWPARRAYLGAAVVQSSAPLDIVWHQAQQ